MNPHNVDYKRVKHRKLRIAWSVAWGIACVLLIVLWVRSKYAIDKLMGPLPFSAGFNVVSRNGGVALKLPPLKGSVQWSFQTMPNRERNIPYHRLIGFIEYQKTGLGYWVRVLYWFPVVLFAALAAAPWIRRLKFRFSLRTLLIATTVVAVVLGLVVWASGN